MTDHDLKAQRQQDIDQTWQYMHNDIGVFYVCSVLMVKVVQVVSMHFDHTKSFEYLSALTRVSVYKVDM